MRLGGRLQAAIEVIEDIDKRHRPVADALRDWGLSHRFAGSGDRSAIGNFVYDAMRRKRTAHSIMGDDSARSTVIGAFLLSANETIETLSGHFDGDRFAPAPLSKDEHSAVGTFDANSLALPVAADIPDWCVADLQSAFGDGWVAEASALAMRPPLDLRANSHKSTQDKVLAALASTGAKACQLAQDGIRIPPIIGHGRHPNVQAEPSFRKGWFEVQDEGSQLVSRLAFGDRASQILDFCAGAGGKTLALSATSDNKGQIFAHDADKRRLAPIFDRLKRAGCRNVQIVEDSAGLAGHEARMDLVLVDAPCTGSGTWRRRPDTKWRLTDRQLETRKNEQAAILDNAAAFVKPGGRLAYVTCSVFSSENDQQIEQFLQRTTDFRAVDHSSLWSGMFPDKQDRVSANKFGILLTPHKTGTDGFFIAVMQRNSTAQH